MMKKIISLLAFALAVSTAYAGGYRVSIQGQKALAMGHAGVAVVNSAELAFFNPSAIVFMENKFSIAASGNAVFSTVKYQNLDTRQAFETDNPVATPINLYATYQINETIGVSLAVYTPYGSSVEYPEGWAGSHLVNSISLASIFINPSIAVKLIPNLSIGAGLIYATGSVEFNRDRDLTTGTPEGRTNIDLDASGVDNFGWNAAASFQPVEEVTIGATYRSKIDLSAEDGDVTFTNSPAPLDPNTTFNATLPLPAELSIGVSAQLTEKLLITAEFNRQYWETYESLDIEFNTGTGFGEIDDSINPRNYKNSNVSRFGIQYDACEKFTVRGGYYFDESPVVPGFFSPETPRNDAHGFTTGFSFNVNDHLAIDASLLYLYFDEVDASYDGFPDDEIPAFEGTYLSSAISVGLGLTYNL